MGSQDALIARRRFGIRQDLGTATALRDPLRTKYVTGARPRKGMRQKRTWGAEAGKRVAWKKKNENKAGKRARVQRNRNRNIPASGSA